MPDRGRCYIETDDQEFVGHFPLRFTELGRTRLAFEIVRKINNHVEVSFALIASEFEEVRRVAEVIFGLREPEPDDAMMPTAIDRSAVIASIRPRGGKGRD